MKLKERKGAIRKETGEACFFVQTGVKDYPEGGWNQLNILYTVSFFLLSRFVLKKKLLKLHKCGLCK